MSVDSGVGSRSCLCVIAFHLQLSRCGGGLGHAVSKVPHAHVVKSRSASRLVHDSGKWESVRVWEKKWLTTHRVYIILRSILKGERFHAVRELVKDAALTPREPLSPIYFGRGF